MFDNWRCAALKINVGAAVGSYIDSCPLWDDRVERTVTRSHSVVVAGSSAVRVTCRVVLHAGTNLHRGEYNAEWTRGLLGEIAEILNSRGFLVIKEESDGGPALEVRRS